MANQHYELDEEFEVTIKLKVKLQRCSDYRYLTEDEVKDEVFHFKTQIQEHLESKVKGEYYREDVCIGMDDWTYEVDNVC
tara:strand:+ start:344 stop:583 length:240 start_codon:yes stop_codon:yes gene_type:complete